MSDGFEFKRFRIEQSRSAMKVGTDGVLLGAWARIEPCHRRILDVGTGTGLVALMAAQRTEEWGARIVGVEIDHSAALDAEENVASSPWSDRVEIVASPIQTYSSDEPFDHIISNPPYFVDSLTSPDSGRTTARHTTSLRFDELAAESAARLTEEGILSLILPYDAAAEMTLSAVRAGLFLCRRTDVSSKASRGPLRSLLEFGRKARPTLRDSLVIHSATGDYSEPYRTLTRDFYLKF